MLNVYTALLVGFACGFIVNGLWVKSTMDRWDRAYKLAAEQMKAEYEQRRAALLCKGCDISNGCPEYCLCTDGVLGTPSNKENDRG